MEERREGIGTDNESIAKIYRKGQADFAGLVPGRLLPYHRVSPDPVRVSFLW